MEPSPEAVAWGKRQASKSPRWNDAKWKEIAIILGLDLAGDGPRELDQAEAPTEAGSWRDAA